MVCTRECNDYGDVSVESGKYVPEAILVTSEPAPTNPTAVARKRYRAHNRMRMGFFFSE